MPIELTESDLVACGKIQETKNTTIAKAKELFRRHAAKLANPDVEGRADIVLENVLRGGKSTEFNTDVFEEEAPVKEKKEKKAKTPKAPKAEKTPKAAKAPKAKKASAEKVSRPDIPLPELEREVEIKSVEEQPHVFTANLFGKKHAVAYAERNREGGADHRFESIGVSERRLGLVEDYAKANDLPVAIAAVVRVKGRLDQGYAIPLEVFEKFKGKSLAVNLSGEARQAYQESGWAGVKFIEVKSEKKAA
jgi:hypothetical protein